MSLETNLQNNNFDHVESVEWKPLYPNNMKCNGVEGYYCLMFHKHKDGVISARKYTILFQHEEITPASGHINRNKITHYILMEKSYHDVKGPLEYAPPSNDSWFETETNKDNTFNSYDMNDYGSFVYAYENIDDAKKRAYTQYKHIFGYVLSFLDESQR